MSTSGESDACSGDEDDEAGTCDTEFIIKLERQGEGWGEEILPRLSLEQRPLKRVRVRNRCSLPDPWAVRPFPCILVLVLPERQGRCMLACQLQMFSFCLSCPLWVTLCRRTTSSCWDLLPGGLSSVLGASLTPGEP